MPSRLQHESRQKRRLEDECALLEQRRWQRSNFICNALLSHSCLARLLCVFPVGHALNVVELECGSCYSEAQKHRHGLHAGWED
eukprot:3930336-Rhodomonas_salina.2